MKLHTTVGLENERLTQFRVIFAYDRVERDLHILGHAKVPSAAVIQQLRPLDVNLDGASNNVRRRTAYRGRFSVDTIEQVAGDPDRAMTIGFQLPAP